MNLFSLILLSVPTDSPYIYSTDVLGPTALEIYWMVCKLGVLNIDNGISFWIQVNRFTLVRRQDRLLNSCVKGHLIPISSLHLCSPFQRKR